MTHLTDFAFSESTWSIFEYLDEDTYQCKPGVLKLSHIGGFKNHFTYIAPQTTNLFRAVA